MGHGASIAAKDSFIERASAWALQRISDVGGFFEQHTAPPLRGSRAAENIAAYDFSVAQAYQDLNQLHYEEVWREAPNSGLTMDLIDRWIPGKWAHGAITTGVSWFGKLVDGATGVIDLTKEFHKEYESGDRVFDGTLKKAVGTTAQLSASGIAGAVASGLLAGVTLPAWGTVGLVGAAAVGSGWLVGKIWDSFAS